MHGSYVAEGGVYTANPTTCKNDTTFVPVDIIGQGTWRVNLERTSWAVWTIPVVSEVSCRTWISPVCLGLSRLCLQPFIPLLLGPASVRNSRGCVACPDAWFRSI